MGLRAQRLGICKTRCFLRSLGDIGPVAGFTGDRRGLVEENVLTVHLFLELVAIGAGNAFMAAFERERCFLVIEEGGFPFVAVVAGGAVVFLVGELLAVRILVAVAALLGGLGEINMKHRAFHVRRFMAIGTFHGTMRADERERRGGVIEARHVLPLLR